MFDNFEHIRVAVDDVDLHVTMGGTGPALLLLHGFPQTHVAWHQVAPRLARDFTLIIPDLPGYGASLGPVPDAEHHKYSKRNTAQIMARLMSKLGHDKFHVAG